MVNSTRTLKCIKLPRHFPLFFIAIPGQSQNNKRVIVVGFHRSSAEFIYCVEYRGRNVFSRAARREIPKYSSRAIESKRWIVSVHCFQDSVRSEHDDFAGRYNCISSVANPKLTLGLDLGDHWSCYCVLDEVGEDHSGAESGDDTGSDEADICEDTAESHRPGDGNAFPVAQPAVNGDRIQSNRGARAIGAIDHQEQAKR